MNQTTANLIRLERAESFLTYQWPLGLRPNLEAQIKLLRWQIPPQTMAVYNRLKTMKSQVVAKVLDGVCQGCQEPVPAALLKKLHAEEDVTCCTHCGRFVYLPDGEAEQAVSPRF